MKLITMAHLGEAQGAITHFQLKRVRPDLFQGDHFMLLITGEGPFEAASRTALCLGEYKFLEVINLGIAGSLSPKCLVGEIYPLRTLYLVSDQRPSFRTFNSKEGVDCITSFERILDPEKSLPLKGIASLVDREAWGVAHAAKTAAVTFSSYKLVSDLAGTLGACELVKEQAHQWSVKLAEYLTALLNESSIKKVPPIVLKDFHFTFTTSHKMENLLNKLSIKKEISVEEVLLQLPLNELRKLALTPKERAGILLEKMEEELDPLKKILSQKKEAWSLPFISQGIDLLTDPFWEDSSVTVTFKIKSDSELKDKLDVLKSLSLRPMNDLMEGRIHVE